jgi:hypothetical protein
MRIAIALLLGVAVFAVVNLRTAPQTTHTIASLGSFTVGIQTAEARRGGGFYRPQQSFRNQNAIRQQQLAAQRRAQAEAARRAQREAANQRRIAQERVRARLIEQRRALRQSREQKQLERQRQRQARAALIAQRTGQSAAAMMGSQRIATLRQERLGKLTGAVRGGRSGTQNDVVEKQRTLAALVRGERSLFRDGKVAVRSDVLRSPSARRIAGALAAAEARRTLETRARATARLATARDRLRQHRITRVAANQPKKHAGAICGRGGCKGVACSFAGDTQVATSLGYVSIEDIVPGFHEVLAKHEITGEVDYQPVLARYANDYEEQVRIEIQDLETGALQTIVSNRIHPFFAQRTEQDALFHTVSSEGHEYRGPIPRGAWVDADDLKPGWRLLQHDGGWSSVLSVEIQETPFTAFNISVESFHTYFVRGAEGIPSSDPLWVHNNYDCTRDLWKSGRFESKNSRVLKGGWQRAQNEFLKIALRKAAKDKKIVPMPSKKGYAYRVDLTDGSRIILRQFSSGGASKSRPTIELQTKNNRLSFVTRQKIRFED